MSGISAIPRRNGNFVTIVKDEDQVVTTTNETQILFDYENCSTYEYLLEMNGSNGNVLVHKGVSQVKVTCMVWVERKEGSYAEVILKNGSTVIGAALFPARMAGQETWCTINCVGVCTVTENDVISAYIKFSSADAALNKISGDYGMESQLIVEVMEYNNETP